MTPLEIAGAAIGAWISASLLGFGAFLLLCLHNDRRATRPREHAGRQERLARVVLFLRREGIQGVVRNPPYDVQIGDPPNYTPAEREIAGELERGGPDLAANIQPLLTELRA